MKNNIFCKLAGEKAMKKITLAGSVTTFTILTSVLTISLPANGAILTGTFEGSASGGETITKDVGNGLEQHMFVDSLVNLNGIFTFDTNRGSVDKSGLSRFPLISITGENNQNEFNGTGFAFIQGNKEDLLGDLGFPQPGKPPVIGDLPGGIVLPKPGKFLGIDANFLGSNPFLAVKFTHTGNLAPRQGKFNIEYSFNSQSSGKLVTLSGEGVAKLSARVPEPCSALGILAFGVIGAGSALKHKQKQQ